MENLWVIKAVLQWFELASGLKINFHNSSVVGVNIHADFLNMAAGFPHCRIGSIPFRYLGLPMGANPRSL